MRIDSLQHIKIVENRGSQSNDLTKFLISELLILTHADDDHIGGILSLLRCGWKCYFHQVRMNCNGSASLRNAYLSTGQNNEVYARLFGQGTILLSMMAGDEFCVGDAKLITIGPKSIITNNMRSNTPLSYRRDYSKSLFELAESSIAKKTIVWVTKIVSYLFSSIKSI